LSRTYSFILRSPPKAAVSKDEATAKLAVILGDAVLRTVPQDEGGAS